ncbi:MAG TPA: hypothetical protein VF610_12485, partial [Segetibacter sp.]
AKLLGDMINRYSFSAHLYSIEGGQQCLSLTCFIQKIDPLKERRNLMNVSPGFRYCKILLELLLA